MKLPSIIAKAREAVAIRAAKEREIDSLKSQVASAVREKNAAVQRSNRLMQVRVLENPMNRYITAAIDIDPRAFAGNMEAFREMIREEVPMQLYRHLQKSIR